MILPIAMLPLVQGSKKARSAAPWLLKDLEGDALAGRHLSADAERLARHALREVGSERAAVLDSCGISPSPGVGSTGDPARSLVPRVHAVQGAGDPC